ncbi:hypothetical protein ACLGIH_20455 [Streptomyces sp. HMX87]|uniref:hypothetical protein n=1 Tax=Streptomyces sp. HMX87 TaxID=3390849 RepID=UPI003A8BC561
MSTLAPETRTESGPPVPLPRIRVRAQSDDEPGAYPVGSEWWEAKDTAAMHAGRLAPLVIEIVDGAGRVMADCPNRIGPPSLIGVYDKPEEIADPWVQYYAADHWTPCFGIEPGDLVTFGGGQNFAVINFEQVDQDYGDVGANTGFLLCQSAAAPAVRFLVPVEELKKVKEITA